MKDNDKIGQLINLFWVEFDDFHKKTGLYKDRDHIWNSTDIQQGNPHFWHYRNSYRYTKILGKLGCRVTSKILGIGSAERAWGDVKHLKTNKRAHLSADKIKKQSIIFGASCMERAQIKRNFDKDGDKSNAPYKFWTEEDFDAELDILTSNDAATKPLKSFRIFKSWKEDWEDEAI